MEIQEGRKDERQKENIARMGKGENFEETGKSTIVKAASSVARLKLDHTDG